MKHRLLFFMLFVVVLAPLALGQYHYNQAGVFNGTSSNVAIASSSEINPTTAITIEAWIWPTRLPHGGNGYGIVGKNFFTSYSLGFGSTGRLFFIPTGSGQLNQRASSTIDTTRWTHVAVTYDGTTTALYLNGVLDTSITTITGPIAVSSDSLRIGAEVGPDYFFPGMIDEVRLWSVARSAADIARDRFIPLAIISGGAMPAGPYFGLVGAWRLNGDVRDEAGTAPNSGIAHDLTYADFRQKQVNYVDYNNTVLLDGTAGYCAAPNAPAFDPSTGVTLEAWVKHDTTSPQNLFQNIINKSGGTNRYDYALYSNPNGDLWFEINQPGGVGMFAGGLLAPREWTHVAATYNSTDGHAVIYINGDSVAGAIFSGNPAIQTSVDSFFVGGIGASAFAGNKFKGQVDQVRIWKDQVRTAEEIRSTMYSNIDFATSPAPTGMIVYGFDGRNTYETASAGALPQINFMGTARMTSSHRQLSAELTSPLLRDDAGGFGGPLYTVSRHHFTVPDNSSAGVTDSVYVSESGTASGVKLFLTMNHTWVSDLNITLTSPSDVAVVLFPEQGGGNNDFMTIFDDNADSTSGSGTTTGFLAPFSPFLKPNAPLATFDGMPRQGWWKLTVSDNAAADLGTVLGWGVRTSPLTGVGEPAGQPEEYALLQNYPNPFNPTTTLSYTLPGPSTVTLKIYNLLGQEVRTLLNEVQGAGIHRAVWNSTNNFGETVGSGVYFYTLHARAEGSGTPGEFLQTRKMLLVK